MLINFKAKRAILMAFFGLLSMAMMAQPLSGTYTIGGTSPNYTSFSAAVTALTTNGVSGAVVFNVRTGVYNEQISISAITGVSVSNTVTFQSQTGDSTAVTLTYSPSSTNNYTLRFSGADYVIFRKMNLKAVGTSYSTVVRYETGSTFNRLENNVIEGTSSTSTSSNMAVIYASATSLNDNVISNNLIKDGSEGIYFSSSSANIQIVQNTFTNQYYRALDLNSLSQLTVTRNIISSNTSYTSAEGIYLSSCGINLVITKNKITVTGGYMGIEMNTCTAATGTRGLIANNFITLGGSSGSCYGFYLYNCNYQNIFYNSVNITRSGSSGMALYGGGSSGSNLQLQNNVFSNLGGGYTIYTDYASIINISDYNDLYTNGSTLCYWAGNYGYNLSSWRSLSGMDVHSVSILPEFTTPSNLHMEAYLLDNLGYPVSGVTDDFDGQTRHVTTPDMGADEWTAPAKDAGVTSIDQGLTYCIVNDSVFVTIKNFGTATLTSVSINWKVNGTTQTPKSWTGSLVQGNSYGPFSIGYYNFNLGTTYSIYAWTSNPNSGTEGFTHNDSTSVLNKYKAMSGIYSIGGTSPDYASFNAAVTDLVNGGVCGPVLFKVRDGIYNEQVSIGPITGTSSTNSVTFYSESGDSTKVSLTFAPSSTNNYTVRFNGCDYVTFRKIKVIANGTAYATVFRIESNSTYNVIDRCLIQGGNTTSTSTNLATIYGSATTITNTIITGNKLSDGSYGIYAGGSSTGIQIIGNTFINQYYRALDLNNLSQLTVSKNTISSNTTYTGSEGIYLSGCGTNLVLTKNKINISSGYMGIEMSSNTANTSARGLIANNFINLTGTYGTVYGIYSYNSTYQNFYNNTINITRSGSGYNFYCGGSSSNNLQLQNNVFSNTGGGFAIYTDYASPINISDYNDLYTNGSYLGYWAGTYCGTLSNWRTSSSLDVHSVSILPEFSSPSDLHIQAYLLDNQGYPVSGVTDDIDGQSRSLTTPDMGADEWSTPSNDAGVTSIDQALTYCMINDSVFVTIKNFGTSTLTSVKINWQVNGTSQTAKSWTGSLAQGNSFGPFSIGYYNFNLGTTYSVYAWTSSPNSGTEGFTHNDSSNVLNKYKSISGTYTIGGTSPDYATFNAAVTDLVNGGVCGPVLFNVRNGVYNEQISISSINGTSSTNTVTFQSETGDSTAVVITYASTTTNNYTVRFNGCDYVTFKKMKVIASGTSYATALRIESNSIYNNIDRCLIHGSNTTSTNANQAVIYSSGSSVTNTMITGNKLSDGSYGIYFTGSSSGVQIIQNTLVNQYYRAMDLSSLSQLTISKNTISSNTSYSNAEGIYLYGCGSSLVLTKNKINMSSGYIGINLYSCTASTSTRGLLANNFIIVSGTSAYGIYLYNSSYQNFYNNSINITRSGSNSNFYCSGSSSSNLQLQNNIFSNTGGGFTIYTDYASPINLSDYNDLYTNGTYIGYWAGNYCVNLSNWRASSGLDVHSVSIPPEFTTPSDLHIQAYLLDNLGYPVSGITDDFDGQSRSLTTPDIGADEWATPANDAGVTSIDQALTYCITNDSVFVTIKNFGTATLTSVTINWKVNGTAQTAKSWTGSLVQGNSFGPFSIGYYNFSLGTTYSVYAWTSSPNSGTEGFTHNDSSSVLNKYKAMSGTYSIGGTSPDYATFNAAVTDLMNGGICGTVLFKVRDGVYNEQVSIGSITGSSSTNTVTFYSESGDSTKVSITFAPTSTNNYTVRFNGCDYVTFRKIKVIANGTSYATAFRIESSSIYNNIDRCLIQGANTTSTNTNQAVIYCAGSSVTNTIITGNKLSDGSYGIYFTGSSSGVQIIQNTLVNQYYRAMDLSSLSQLTISKNTISSNTTYTSAEGIYLYGCGSSLVMTMNKIIMSSGNMAIEMYLCTASNSTRGLFANNFIVIAGTSGTAYGIYSYNSTYQNFYNNSINITRSGSGYNFYCSGSSSSNLQLQNNIFSNTGGGFTIYTDYASPINISDYNDLYTNGSYLGYWTGTYCTTLGNWRTSSGLDVHSVSILPEFFTPSDLHIQSYLLDNLGYPVSGVTDDFDGQARSFTTPDMGADEWVTPANDAGVTSIDQALTYCMTNDSVFVTIKNFGSATLTSAKINWKVNGTVQTAKSWTGSLSQGQTFGPFSIGYYNFSLGSAYSVYAWTSDPNGSAEGFTHNDSGSVLNKYKAMSGTYTIGGTSPDYTTFNAAVTDLVNGGVCGPVVFNVRNGIYNEQLSIARIPGTSSTNTITFQSETGDSTAVGITYASTTSINYTVRFNSCEYVTFRKMKVIATGSTYGVTFRIESNAINNIIDRCIIQGYSATSTSANFANIYCGANIISNTIITGNKFMDGSYGIYINSVSSGIIITNNTFLNHYYRAMDISSVTSLTISRNTISSNTTYASAEGIYLYNCGSNLVISRNKITLVNGQIALDMYNCIASGTTRGMITNNFISIAGTTSSAAGIYIYNSNYQNFYYNSVNITRTVTNTQVVNINGSSTNNLQFQNNVFSNTSGGYIIYTSYTSAISLSDYNDLYATGTYIGYWGSTNCTSLANWRAFSGLDIHSVTTPPGFFSPSDLHLCNTLLSNAAMPISSVTEDFDGQARSVSNPDIGADEFGTVLTVNLGADKISCTNVTLDAAIPNSKYLWSTSDTTQTISASSPGTYWVRVTNACGAGSDTIVIKNTPPVPGTIFGPDSLCQGKSGNVYSIATVTGATTYTWTVPGGWSITAGQGSTSVTVSSSSTSGNICVASGSGCASSATSCKVVNIQLNVSAPLGITGDTSVCANDTGLIYSTPAISGATGYNWTVPSGWTIVNGQGTKQIELISGSTGGNICVSSSNNCNTSSPTCKAITITGSIANPGSINGNKTVCANQTGLVYFITAVNGAKTYNWTVPAGWTISSGQGTTTLTVKAGIAGGNVCVTASNSCSVSSASCTAISIQSAPAKPDTITGLLAICPSQSGLTYSISAVSGATSYNWTVPAGWTITSGQGSIMITANANNNVGNICVTAANACAVSSAACLTIVKQSTPPKPDSIVGLNTICAGQGGLTYSISSVAGATSYNWTVPAGWAITSGQGTTSITVNANNVGGNICVTSANSCAISAFKCLTISIISAPGTPGSINGATSVCPGQTGLTYSIPLVAGAMTYTWTVSPGWVIFSGQGSNIISVVAGSVAGNICVVATNTCASSTQQCLPVSINNAPGKPVAVIGDNSICANETNLPYYVAPVSGATSYIWTLPSGWSFVSGQGNDTILVNASAVSGSVSVVALNTCGSSISTGSLIVVNPLPPKPIISQTTKKLTSNAATGNQWYFGVNILNGATAKDYTPTQTGWYSVEVTDVNGCKSFSDQIYFVLTGINDGNEAPSAMIYPNPSNGKIYVQFSHAGVANTQIEMLDILGQKVYSVNHKIPSDGILPLELTLSTGTYIFRATLGNQFITKQLMIQ